jgi:hypothetical protein
LRGDVKGFEEKVWVEVDKIQKDFINFKNEISTKLMDVIRVNNELFIVEKKGRKNRKIIERRRFYISKYR